MTHQLRTVKNIDNGKHGDIEILVAVHDYSEDQDAIVIRTYGPAVGDGDPEVWISTTALREVASALEDNQPKQLSLFDQES